jgi:signal transduction histidine kinase
LAGINDLPAIEGDPIALPKVFYQLIVNAIKYTPDGGTITISGRNGNIDGEDSPTKGIDIIISDTGIGIDPEFHELIFTKFYQTGELALHSTGRTKFKGAGPGLGLAIARGIVEAHQGKLWVESPGHDENTCPGSRFHVLLPLRQSKVASQQIKSPTTSHKRAKALVEKQTE